MRLSFYTFEAKDEHSIRDIVKSDATSPVPPRRVAQRSSLFDVRLGALDERIDAWEKN